MVRTMQCAIYARLSLDNQSENAIDIIARIFPALFSQTAKANSFNILPCISF